MSTNVKSYHNDGATRQVQAVLAMFQEILGSGIEASWSDRYKDYEADIKVARWENCREQGYVLFLRLPNRSKQLNIAFYEHRNSDDLCALMWHQFTLNSPNLDTMPEDIFVTKWDTTHEEKYGKVTEMARWIHNELERWWINET